MPISFNPILDRVLIERFQLEEKVGSLYIPPEFQQKAGEGVVVAVGQGKENKDGSIRPLFVKVGDKVMFERHMATDLKLDGKEYAMVREDQIFGVIDANEQGSSTK